MTKAEETETANVNAAWAKMKAKEAKLEADELKAMSLEDAKSEIWNMVAERNKVEAKLEACERKAMAQEDTIEKANEQWRGYRKQRLEVRRRFIVHRWVKGLARHKARKKKNNEKDGELVHKKARRAQHKQKEKSDRKSGRKKLKKEGMADNLRKQKKLDNAQQVYEEAVEVLQKVMMCGP